MKKILSTLLICAFILFGSQDKVWAKDMPPEVSAQNIVLMDGTTGEILYSKNPDVAEAPASTTKIMTALLTLENTKLDDKVTVGKNPPFADGSKAGIAENEILTVRDLLYGMLFVSGNDCAETLAEYIGGTKENFAVMMNKRASELGCKNTNFVNPSGLYDPNHKTSAMDLALIMKELVTHEDYTKIASSNATYNIISENNPSVVHPVSNENKMTWKNGKFFYPGFEGGKTGYTTQSLHSYVVSAKRDNQRLIVAMVHSQSADHYINSAKLLDYGFKNYETIKLYSKGDLVSNYAVDDKTSIPLLAAEDISYTKERASQVTSSLSVAQNALSTTSFSKGDQIAEATITLSNNITKTLKLESGADYSVNKLLSAVPFSTSSVWQIFKISVVTFLSLFVALMIIRKVIKRNRKRYKSN